MLTFEEAREEVIREVTGMVKSSQLAHESISLNNALGRVLAREIHSDRDYPPFDRSIRDGFAVRAADAVAGAKLTCIGEIKAGDEPKISVSPGTCVQIMTGAALPAGANAVVMIEQTRANGSMIEFSRDAAPEQHLVLRGREAVEGQLLLGVGTRLGFAEIAVAAQVGAAQVEVFRKPRVAILSTGNEIVPADAKPGNFQIRNSNAFSLAAQVTLAGGEPVTLLSAKDTEEDLREKILLGLKEDILILSGGVSAGKYDFVEKVLHDLEAEKVFDAVAIRPGKPTVFATCREKPIFGLPGNPISTMVTFELFVVPAIQLLAGAESKPLPFLEAHLGGELHEKTGLAHFLPAHLYWVDGIPTVKPLPWQGSGDLAAASRGNCFLFVPHDRGEFIEGETVLVLPRLDVL